MKVTLTDEDKELWEEIARSKPKKRSVARALLLSKTPGFLNFLKNRGYDFDKFEIPFSYEDPTHCQPAIVHWQSTVEFRNNEERKKALLPLEAIEIESLLVEVAPLPGNKYIHITAELLEPEMHTTNPFAVEWDPENHPIQVQMDGTFRAVLSFNCSKDMFQKAAGKVYEEYAGKGKAGRKSGYTPKLADLELFTCFCNGGNRHSPEVEELHKKHLEYEKKQGKEKAADWARKRFNEIKVFVDPNEVLDWSVIP